MLDTLPTGFTVQRKITEQDIALVMRCSQFDAEVRQNTNDVERFGSESAFRSWLKEKHAPFLFFSTDGSMACFVWFSEKHPPISDKSLADDLWITTAIRVYEPFRGKGLSKQFFSYAIQTILKEGFAGKKIDASNLWIVAKEDNVIGLKVYHALGFQEIERINGHIFLNLRSDKT